MSTDASRLARCRDPDQRADLRAVRPRRDSTPRWRRAGSARIRRSASAGRGIRSIPTTPSAWRRPRSCSVSSPIGVTDSGAVLVDDGWRATYIPNREPYPTGIFAACNNAIKADLTAALQAVVDAGLAGAHRCRQRQHVRRLLRPAVHPHRRHATRHRCRGTRGPRRSTRTPSPTAKAACRRWTAASCASSASTTSPGAATSSPPTACTSNGSASRATVPVPVAVLPQRGGWWSPSIRGLARWRPNRRAARSAARQPWHHVRRRWLGAGRRLSAASLSSRWQLDS